MLADVVRSCPGRRRTTGRGPPRPVYDFQRFFAERLAPAVREVGLAGQPDVRFTSAHRLFVAPGAGGGA